MCCFVSVCTTWLWWKFYVEYEKRQQFTRAFDQTFDETSEIISTSFNVTGDMFNKTFYLDNMTVDGESLNTVNEFNASFLVGAGYDEYGDDESVFLIWSIVASIVTVRFFVQVTSAVCLVMWMIRVI